MRIGKRVVDDLYIHVSAIHYLESEDHRQKIRQALALVPAGVFTPNVAKLNLRSERLSLLSYMDFEKEPFPELAASWSFATEVDTQPTYRVYTGSLNPPILHRKELLVTDTHPGRAAWVELTLNPAVTLLPVAHWEA